MTLQLPPRPRGSYTTSGDSISTTARTIAARNLESLSDSVDLIEVRGLTKERYGNLLAHERSRHLVVLTDEDIFGLDNTFETRRADLVFHSRFRHHLTHEQKVRVDFLVPRIAATLIEFDETSVNRSMMLIQSLATWSKPPLLNGAVLSRLREQSEDSIRRDPETETLQHFWLLGAYLKINRY